MNKRPTIIAFLTVGLGLLLILSSFITAQPSLAQEGEETESAARRGSVLYAQYCSACHGPEGESIGTGEAFAPISNYDPNFVRGRIVNGYDSNVDDDIAMFGYGESADGPLADHQVDDLVAYMDTWNNPDVETPELPEPNIEPGEKEYTGPGNPEAGAEIYASSCLGCHGRDTQGLDDLENFPGFEINENTIRVVASGDGHGVVPAFAVNNGGPLNSAQLENLEAYLNTVEVEPEEEEPQGVSILLIILGLGAVLAVGGAYLANRRAANSESNA